jgi:hypothetical protein
MAMIAITTNSSISVKAFCFSKDSAHTVLLFYWVTVGGTLGIRFLVSTTFARILLSTRSAGNRRRGETPQVLPPNDSTR